MVVYPIKWRDYLRTVELDSNSAVIEGMRKTGAKSVRQFLFWVDMAQKEKDREESQAYRSAKRRGDI